MANGSFGIGKARLALDDDQDGWAGAAERSAEDSVLAGKRQQEGQKRADGGAIGLVDLVLHGQAQQIAAAPGKGQTQKRHRLQVLHHVVKPVAGRKHRASHAGGQRLGRERDDCPPVLWRRRRGRDKPGDLRRPRRRSRPASRRRRCRGGPRACRPRRVRASGLRAS